MTQAVCTVHGQVLPKLCSGLDRYRTFFNDQPIPVGALCNHPRYPFDRRQIRVSIRKRWRTNTDEDCLSPCDRVFGRSKAQSTGSARGFNDFIQVGLENWHYTILQFAEFFEITLTAEHIMTDLGQASGCGQPHISCTYDRNSHLETPVLRLMISNSTRVIAERHLGHLAAKA